MPAATSATPAGVFFSEIPGRFTPILVVDKRNPGSIASSTTTSCQLAYLPRAESLNSAFTTPTTEVSEIGTNYIAGMYDDIAENKLTLTSHDVGFTTMSLLTGVAYTSGTTTYGFNEFNQANIDIVRQFAAPNGKIYYSEFVRDYVIEDYTSDLKVKSDAMESYSLTGFNTAQIMGFVVTKAIKATSTDVTAGYLDVSAVLGPNEGPVQIIAPGAGTPAAYWTQIGCTYFLKIERYRASSGFQVLTEGVSASTGVASYNSTSNHLTLATGDLVAGDLFLLTYRTYKSDVTTFSALSGVSNPIGTIPQLTTDTSDPVAVPTRLIPITFAGVYGVKRAQSLAVKLTIKRDRAEGIGDVNGFYGPSDPPSVTVDIDVKASDMSLDAALGNAGVGGGTDVGGPAVNDFVDPNYNVRKQLGSSQSLAATLSDPRTAAHVKTITVNGVVLNSRSLSASSKSAATIKYSGHSQFGQIVIS